MVLLLAFASGAAAEASSGIEPEDLARLPIEELMNIEVSTASRFTQKTSEAPSATSIITAADIKAYGYRTLADVLRSVRGFYTSYDRNYEYLGVRGFNRPGDYLSRILLLVDGYRVNETFYDAAAIGTDFFLDVDLIDRVEIVRGPGSSVYGSNAFFGVINVITKRGKDYDGVEASGELAGFGTDKERLTIGRQQKNGLEWMVSGTRYDRKGPNLYYPQFDSPANPHGIAQGLDYDRNHSVYGKASYGGFTLVGAYSDRIKGIPTASYGTVFNDPRSLTTESQTMLDLKYYRAMGENLDVSTHAYYGGYFYHGIYPYTQSVNKDQSWAQWWGMDFKAAGHYGRHRLVLGGEYQDNFRQQLNNSDLAPWVVYTDIRRNSFRYGFYAQDEIGLVHGLLLNAGLRFDHYSTSGDALNPRLGLIWNPWENTALKLLYGTAFRAPNLYELNTAVGSAGKPSPGLKPEKITSYEFIVEHYFQPDFRLTLDLYRNEIGSLIDLSTDPADGKQIFINRRGLVETEGAELELERQWRGGGRLRASYAWQNTRDEGSGKLLSNSPVHMAKLNLSQPVWEEKLRAGLELQYTDSRKTLKGETTGGYLLTNLTLLSGQLVPGLEISASLYNLFDRHYALPVGEELVQDAIIQDGRSFRIKWVYRF
ncbi:MAG: TonB-dependent receptor [Methylococcaceae bacterium]|nr:TonB-dependent receptor [Methylococcaceae bacterium]